MAAKNDKKKILIVEDDLDIREAIVELLSDSGYAAVVAKDGSEALERLASGTVPNLILLDLMMPVMDGFAFREKQLANPDWAKIPVVVMSADGNVGDKQTRTKAKAYVKKPVDIEHLLSVIEEYLEA